MFEPDFWLVGYESGEPSEGERAQWHGQWHAEHPEHGVCDNPERPRSLYNPQPMPFLNYGLLVSFGALVLVLAWAFR